MNLPGGPILEDIEGESYVIGIHTAERTGSAMGVQFNAHMHAQLNKWIKVDEE